MHVTYPSSCGKCVLEFVSLFVSSVTFFLGQFTVDAGNYGAAFQEAASVMALLINLGFLCFALWSLVKIHLNSEKSRSPTLEDPSSVEMTGLPQEALVVLSLSADLSIRIMYVSG